MNEIQSTQVGELRPIAVGDRRAFAERKPSKRRKPSPATADEGHAKPAHAAPEPAPSSEHTPGIDVIA